MIFQNILICVSFKITLSVVVSGICPIDAINFEKPILETQKNDTASVNSLRVFFKVLPPEHKEIAGGVLDLDNGTTMYLEGSGVELIWDLRDSMNISLNFNFSDDWAVVFDKVVHGDADLGAALFFFTSAWFPPGSLASKSIYLLHPVLEMTSNAYFRQPQSRPYYAIVTSPFQANAWFVFLICLFLCTILLTSLTCNYSSGNCNVHTILSGALLWAVASIYGRNYPIFPRRKSTELAVLSTMLLNLVIFAFYTAKFHVLFSTRHDIIQKPEDLLNNGYTLASYSEAHVDRLFRNMEHKAERAANALQYFYSKSNDGHILPRLFRTEAPSLALLAFSDGLFYLDPNNVFDKCKLSVFKAVRRSQRSMFLNRRSPLKDAINVKLLQLMERGLNFRYQRIHRMKYEYQCAEERKNTFLELTLPQTYLVFHILMFAAVIAIFIEIFNSFTVNKKNYIFLR